MIVPELLAPAGNMSKLKTAVYFGADAVYVGGKEFSLRSYADNFSKEELKEAVDFCHERDKKLYVTVNIFAKNADFEIIPEYVKYLYDIGVDAVIVSDIGVIATIKEVAPLLPIHLSTQANTLNKIAVKFWAQMGIARVVIARELSLKEIAEIHEYVPEIEIEAFVHGAMCIAYSGRCLMSNYLTGRDSNRGECVQACRWQYRIREVSRHGDSYLELDEDERGTYIFNSKDLNMSRRLKDMTNVGIVSLKIEGRMKSEYYLATIVNAYRRALDILKERGEDFVMPESLEKELDNASHRDYTEAYADGDNPRTVTYDNSQLEGDCTFVAMVIGDGDGEKVLVEMRNRFKIGDTLEVLSPTDTFAQHIEIQRMTDMSGNEIDDARLVQQKLYIYTGLKLNEGDILRIRRI